MVGAILVLTAIKLFLMRDEGTHPERNAVYRLFRRFVPSVTEYHGSRFTIVQNGKRYATPLLAVLVLIEWTDLVFAVDSIPAIFAVTSDPFIVYTSNIFAILGLRSLYFVLAAMVHRFHYLKYALSLVLVYVGSKIFVQQFIGKIDPAISLGITISILLGGIALSLWKTRNDPPEAKPALAE